MNAYLIDKNTNTIKSVLDNKTLFFGTEDFIQRIIKEQNCFICGTEPTATIFNNEHIIPDWVLRLFALHKEQVTLPNDTYIKYGSYTVPCCKNCNADLGDKIEKPVSNLLKQPYSKITEDLKNNLDIQHLLFSWMCLTYFKTHLKDTTLQMERDRRISSGTIGEEYDWSGLHHVHCMARLHHTLANVHNDVFGSLLVLPAITQHGDDVFDYMDNLGSKTALIKLGDICIIAVLDDARLCQSMFGGYLSKITGPLTSLQLKEIFSHMVYINANLKTRPQFHSKFGSGRYSIDATIPENTELRSQDAEVVSFGELLHTYVHKLIPGNLPDRNEILQSIKEGKRQFLFNEKGEFLQYPSLS